MSTIRDITGMCFEQGLDWGSGDCNVRDQIVITYSGVKKFEGSHSEYSVTLSDTHFILVTRR